MDKEIIKNRENEPGKWYENLTYQELKRFIGNNMQCMARDFVATGYYLKQVKYGDKFKEDGYKDIWEFAEDMYGISRSTCSRWMAINDKFSENGNSPTLAEKYRNFGKSQLQEMLYLEDSQLDAVTPGMTVRDIKELRRQEETTNVEPEEMCDVAQTEEEEPENPVEPYKMECITGWSRYPDYCSCCGYGDAKCCSQCDERCIARCRWVANPYIPEDDIPGQMTVEDYPELLPEPEPCAMSHIEGRGTVEEEKSGKCLYREGFSCTLSEKAKKTPGDGSGCNEKCCWECTKRGCKLECHSSSSREEVEQEKDEPVADVEYQEVETAGNDRSNAREMITFVVEAFLEKTDVDAMFSHSGNAEEFYDQIYDILRSNSIDFIFCSTELRAEFFDEIEIVNISTGREIGTAYSWERFFQELDDIGRIGEKYAAETQQQEDEKYEELSELSDLELLQEKLEKEECLLAGMQEEFTDSDKRVRTQKMIVCALTVHIQDMEKAQNQPAEPVQPEFPVLKNNEQRKEWLRNYKDWGLWYEDEHIGCKYYKYDFENGARLIAETYVAPKSRYCDEHEVSYLHLVGGPEPPKDKTGCYGKWQRHEKYNKFPSSETELVEFLKYVQKEK